MSVQPQPEGWSEYRLLVVGALADLKTQITVIGDRIDQLIRSDLEAIRTKHAEDMTRVEVRLTRLDVRSGMVGLLGGLIPATLAVLYILIAKR